MLGERSWLVAWVNAAGVIRRVIFFEIFPTRFHPTKSNPLLRPAFSGHPLHAKIIEYCGMMQLFFVPFFQPTAHFARI